MSLLTASGLEIELPPGWTSQPIDGGPVELRPQPDGSTGILQVSRMADSQFDFIAAQEPGQFAAEFGTRLTGWGTSAGNKAGECAMGRFGFSMFQGGQFPTMLLWITVAPRAAYLWTWLGPGPPGEEVRQALGVVTGARAV